MNENALNTFYNNIVKSDTTFSADYDTFKNGMQDANVRKELYKRLRESNSKFPSNDYDVDAVLGFQTQFDKVATEATNKAVSSLRNEKYASLSDDEIYEKWNSLLSKGEQNRTANIEKLKKENEQFAKQKPFLYAVSMAGMQSGPAGDRMPTPIEALEEKQASTFLDPSDLEEFKALDKERGVRIYESGNKDVKTSTIAASNEVKDIRDRANRNNKKLSARERIDLNMAERINDMSQELIEAPSKFGEESGVENWGKGLSDTLFDRDIISVVGMVRDWEVSNVVKKLNDGETLSEAENAMIMAVANFDEVQASRSSDLSVGYQIGQGTAQCVPLIVDMMVTKGLGTAGKRALIKSLDKLVKAGKMTQKSVDRFARILNGTKGVTYTMGKGDDAVNVTVGALEEGAKKTFGQYAGDAARELVETGIQTYAMPSSQRQMIQAKTDLRRESGNNDISLKDRARIFGDAYTQTFTERAGGKAIDWALGKVFGMTNVLQKFGYDRGILKLLNNAVQNPISEIGEEYLGAVINLVRSADLFDIYSEQSNEDLRDEAMSMFTSEGFWKTVGTTLPMSLFGGASNYGAIKAETNRYNKSYLELSQYLQKSGIEKSQAENILRQVESAKDNAEFKERMSILKTYLTNYIMENNPDTEVAKGKLEGMKTLLDTYSNNRDSYEEAIGGLEYALSSMSKEAKEKVAEDFKKLVDNANRSITATPQKEGKDITPTDKQTAGWAKRKYAVTIDGKKESITIQGELYFNEDGSINSTQTDMGKVHIQNEQGKNIRTTVKADKKKEVFNKYLDAINDELRKQKAQKDAEAIAEQKAEEERKAELSKIKAEEKAKVDAENAKLDEEKQAIAQQEADRQSILSDIQQNKTKQGEIQMDKLTPEETLLVYQNEETPESLMQLLAEQLQYLRSQETDIQGKDLSPIEKKNKTRKIQQSIASYEAAIEKWLGQEALAVINAPVGVSLIQEETPAAPPVQAPVVEPVQSETPVTAEPAVAPEEEVPQEEPTEPDTTPLPPAEPVDTRTKIINVEQDMADGNIKAYYSVNGGGQWYVVKDGAIVARSEKANKGDMPNNATEVNASIVYKDENGIKKPVILITTIGDYHNLRKKDAVIIDEYGLTTADTQSLHDREVKTDESTGEEIEDFIQINQNTSESKKEREEIKKYTTLDSLLGFPLLRFRGNEVFTMKDLLELGYRTGSRKTVAKQKDGSRKPVNKSVLYSPYDLVKGMLREKYPNDTDVEIQEHMNHFANQFQRAAARWNELVASNHAGIEGLSIDNVNIQTSSTGDHQTAIAQFMMTASEAVNNGIITTKVSEKVDTLPKKFNPDTKDRIVSNRTNEEILDDVQQLEQEIESLEKLSEFEDTKKDIAAAKRKLNNLIKALSDSQAQFLSEQYKYGYVADYLKKRIASKQHQEVGAPAGKEGDTTKEAPAKPKANIDKLRDTFVEAYARTQNQSYNALQKTMAKTAFKGMIDKMSEEDAVALYLNLGLEGTNSQGKMQEDMVNAAQALLDSKHGAAINAITGGAQQDTNPTPVESTEVATEETEQTAEDAIDYEALVAERNELQETIYDMEEDEAANANARIAQINEILRNRSEFMVGDVVAEHAESTKRIIKILKAAGIRVVTFKNEDLPKYVSKKKLEELSDGQIVYGFASNDTIYLNEDHFNPNSPLHEFTHLWVTAYKQAFPNEWKRFVEIANKSALAANLRKPLKDGKENPYANLSADEMASEVLSRYTGYLYGELDAEGKTAFENMMQAQTMEEKIAEKSLLKRIRDFWKKIISWFDKSIENEKKEETIDDMIRRFAQEPMETLARGRVAVDELKQLAKQGYKVQSVYHGTAVEFDYFNHDFMGSGEGAQAYGWGTYVTQVKEIGVSYANRIRDYKRNNERNNLLNGLIGIGGNNDMEIMIKNFETYVLVDDYKGNFFDYVEEQRIELQSMRERADKLRASGYANVTDDEYAKYVLTPIDKRDQSLEDRIDKGLELNNLKRKIKRLEESLSTFDNLPYRTKAIVNETAAQILDLTNLQRVVYEVQIPADAYLEDGSIDLENSPYLGWDDTYMSGNKFFNAIMNAIKEYSDKRMRRFQELKDRMVFHRSRPSNFENSPEDLSEYWDIQLNSSWIADAMRRTECTGGYFYGCIENMFGSPKAASEWLLSNGILGVRVSTNATSGKKRDTKNYVIFNEADAHIVNHTAFMIGDDGKLMLNNTQLNLDNSKKSSTFAQNNGNYERNDERTMDGEVPSGSRRGESRTDSSNGEGRSLLVRDVPRANGGYDADVAQSVAEQSRLLSEMLTERGIKHTSKQVKLATPQEFYDAIIEAKQLNPHGWMVDAYGAEDYAGFTCLLTEDGKSGIAIKPNGDIISVFSSVKRDNRLQMLMPMAIMQGGRKLDCYYLQGENGNIYGLPKLYSTFGFKIAATTNFVEEYVPQEEYARWKEEHNGSIQGVAAMYISDEVANDLINSYSISAAPNTNAQNFPSTDTGYGEALAERDKLMILENARANGTIGTINGKKSNLPDELWAVVRTDAFKDWFGDWQNDPDNASKVLDENGEPLVVYHGSKMAGFDEFQQLDESVNGFFTTDNKAGANTYATNREERRNNVMADEAQLNAEPHHGIYSLFANIKNPAVYDFAGKMYNEYGEPQGYYVEMSGEEWDMLPVPKFATEEEALAFARENGEPDSAVKTTYLSTDDLVEMAKAAGHDGVIFKNVLDGAEHNEEQPVMNDYIAFEPNQLKSATQNIGTYSSEDNRIEFMIGPAAANETEEKIKKASEDVESAFVTADVPLPDKTNALAKLATAVCDSGEAFRQFMKALRKYRKENHLGKLPEGRDIRQIYDNQRVVLKNKVDELLNLYETPLEETLEKLIKVVENSSMYQKYKEDRVVYTFEEEDADGKITTKTWTDYVEITPREFIERYLIACDSVERINNGIPPRGLREFYSRMGVNVYDFQMEFEAAFASDGQGEVLVKELWQRINAYTNYTLEDSYECGMLTDEEYNKRKARKFYVPERDFQAEKELEQTEIKPQKHYRSNKLASSKQAKGGDSLAANIIENMIHIGNIDLSKNNKNRVKLAMFNLLKENEDFRRSIGLPKPEEVWYDSDGNRVSNKPSKTLIERIKWLEAQIAEYDALITIEEAQAVPDMVEIAQLEKEMQDLIDERKGIPYMLEYDARDKFFGENNPHMVGVYVDGVLCSMQFPNMGLIATALNDTWADSLAVRDVLKRISGFMGSVITSYEPSFFTVNTVTDSMAILTKGYVELGLEYSARFIATTKDLGKHMSLITAYMTGKDYRSMENGDLFRYFLMNGGNTGYATIRNMETILEELQVLDNKSNHIKDTKKWLKKTLSFTNESAELLLRFAAYKAAIECGYGVEKATWAANNLSANFNRTGKKFNDTNFGWRALGEAMEWFKSLSMFTNPAIQGAMSYLRMFGDSGELSTKERVAKYFRLFNAAMFMPALCGFLNAMMFDDDEQEEWAVSEYDRANYLVLGKLGKWAVPHMLRPFYNIGVNIAMGMQGRRTGGDIADSIITSFLTHLTPLPPVLTETASKGVHSAFGNADFTFFDGIESLVSPQGINTLKELADGENFLGYKVRYEGSTAQYTKNPNAGAFEKIIAEQFYIWGGGIKGSDSKITDDKDTIGRFWDVSPNEVKSVMQLFLPKLVIDVANITAGAVSEEHDVRLKDIPVVNRFVSDRTKEAYRAGIYSEANKITKANDMIVKAAKGDIERLKIDLSKASSEEERVRIQGEIDFYEGIHKQAKGDVFATTIEKNLEKYKRIRMASLHKKYHHDEKSFKELYPDLKYDVIEDAERMFTFNMFQLVCMYNGTGKVNDNLPNWMKDVFRMKPSTQEVNEMWEHYQKLQEENNKRLGLSEQ